MALLFYFALKNLVLPREAGSSMGQACPALRESEFSGSALKLGVLNHKSQALRQKNGGQANYK